MANIGNNAPCPCGSAKKYKRCCKGKVDWERLQSLPDSEYTRYLTIRGKNLWFLQEIFGALQFDSLAQIQMPDIKRAFTPKAVERIHEALTRIWPDLSDYENCVGADTNGTAAIYTGYYQPESILRAVSRHALYSERIYFVDPFLDPRLLKPEYNPLLHPEEHRASTLKSAMLWFQLYPWIQAGIVGFLRPLSDFVPGLKIKCLEAVRKRAAEIPELIQVLEKEVDDAAERGQLFDSGMNEYYFLSTSNEVLRRFFKELPSGAGFKSEEEFLRYIQLRRDSHPFFADRLPNQQAEFLYETSGGNYELIKAMCSLSGAHMITDMSFRWKEIELDRPKAETEDRIWEPFAKALQSADLKLLSNIPLDAVLRLRKENRLEELRSFFVKVWKNCREPNAFSEANATTLVAELKDRIGEAEAEWLKIKADLATWCGGSGLVAAVASMFAGVPPETVAGAGVVAGGTATLVQSCLKKKALKAQYPAAFFLGLKPKTV